MHGDNRKERLSQSCQHSNVTTAAPIHRTLSFDQLDRTKAVCTEQSSADCKFENIEHVHLINQNSFEGFLCPICKCDLGRPDYLQVHFQRKHATVYDAYSSINTKSFDLKSFLNRAKNKVLQSLDSSISGENLSSNSVASNNAVRQIISVDTGTLSQKVTSDVREQLNLQNTADGNQSCPLELKLILKSQTSLFFSFRSLRTSFRVQYNEKILTRLQKLSTIDTFDFNKRRVIEKHITQWIDDRDVDRCPDCSISFGLLRRKHHCRLCGFVICYACSWFLSVPFAIDYLKNIRSLTNSIINKSHDQSITVQSPNNIDQNIGIQAVSTLQNRYYNEDRETLNESTNLSTISYQNNVSNRNSSTFQPNEQLFIRLCTACRQILKNNYETDITNRTHDHTNIMSLYRQMTCTVDKLNAIKMKSIHSINLCKSSTASVNNYSVNIDNITESNYKSASFLSYGIKDKLERSLCTQLDSIHSVIKQIDEFIRNIELHADSDNDNDSNKTGSKTMHIQKTIATNLKQYGLTSIKEGITCRSQLNQIANRDINADKHNICTQNVADNHSVKQKTESTNTDKSPIIEQIVQVKKFIQSAKEGKRYDEVWALEANLRELQIMLND